MNVYSSENRHDRYIQKTPNKRKKCQCGCNGRITHLGMAQGAVMMSGCELTVRRWVKYE